jgi:hypothetical protein
MNFVFRVLTLKRFIFSHEFRFFIKKVQRQNSCIKKSWDEIQSSGFEFGAGWVVGGDEEKGFEFWICVDNSCILEMCSCDVLLGMCSCG